jgi:beta-glucosidase
MKCSLSPLIWLLLPLGAIGQTDPNPAPQLGKNSIKEVVAAMTLEEKARIVVGMGFRMPGGPARRDSAARAVSTASPDPATTPAPEKVPGAAGRTLAIPRLGIPSVTVSDGPAGVRINPIRNNDSSRTYYATAFPVATLLASSWDTALVRKVGVAFGSEVHEYGVDILLGPAMNIHRNPLGGRNFEYFSEDPLITGNMAAAMVSGLQSNGVGTSIKHFAANNQETNRNTVNTIVGERALREIYLKGFEIAVKKSDPWTVMTSYNKINGVYTAEQPELVTSILRGEWGFKGMVMTDWFGGKDPVAMMKAGNDLLMPGTPAQTKSILQAVNDGKLDIKILDQNVGRVLALILKSPSFRKYAYSDKPDLIKNAQISRQAASEGMVLLKNSDNLLPFRQAIHKLAVFGITSYEIIPGGTGSGNVNKAYTVSLAEGLANAGMSPDATLAKSYLAYIADAKAKRPKQRNFFMLPPPIPEMKPDAGTIEQLAAGNDLAIITLGRNAGEGADRKLENDFYLSAAEKDLISQVSQQFHTKGKKLVVILNIGGVIETASWRDNADAILLAWQPGQEAGNAIADVLSGRVNPSGKLATSFPMDYTDVPSARNFPGRELAPDTAKNTSPFQGKPSEVVYEEGIYVGYRYYKTFEVKTAYEFGYGLSYTKFSYGNLKVTPSSPDGKLQASLTITNTGNVPGSEVVQLYVSASGKSMDKPAVELKGFAKTKILKPHESVTLVFSLGARDLASFDVAQSAWIAEAGTYGIGVGASSNDIRLKGTFALPKELVTERTARLLAPAVPIQELKNNQRKAF